MGDYAGQELFLLEGDSLLLRCFSDPDLDFDHGFQLLHAVYAVEYFLQGLAQRKCNFHVVFFDSHKDLCLPRGVLAIDRPKYLLARAVIQRHLSVNLRTSHPTLEIHSFASEQDAAFREYLKSTGVYFVMCHDGANPVSLSTDPSLIGATEEEQAEIDAQETSRKVAFRAMICWLMNESYNVALLNGLEWADTKVMSIVVEGGRKTKFSFEYEETVPSLSKSNEHEDIALLEQAMVRLDLKGKRETISGGHTCQCRPPLAADNNRTPTEREILTIVTLTRMLEDPTMEDLATHFLAHTALIDSLPLSKRRQPTQRPVSDDQPGLQSFLAKFSKVSCTLISSRAWSEAMEIGTVPCDISDLIDGRLIEAVTMGRSEWRFPPQLKPTFESLARSLCTLSGVHLKLPTGVQNATTHTNGVHGSSLDALSILPFSNPVFDRHLTSINLRVEPLKSSDRQSGRIFQEVSHWHNAKRRLDPKQGQQTPTSAKDKARSLKRDQRFMAEMQSYAASLTNAAGKALEPEIVTVSDSKGSRTPVVKESDGSGPSNKKSHGAKAQTNRKGAVKKAMLEDIAATKAVKDSESEDKLFAAWRTVRNGLEPERSLQSKYHKIRTYLRDLPDHKRKVLEAEVHFHLLAILFDIYRTLRKSRDGFSSKEELFGVLSLLWDTVRRTATLDSLTTTIAGSLKEIITTLQLPDPGIPTVTTDRKLACDPGLLLPKDNGMAIDLGDQDFQLLHCGPYMDRNLDSAPDTRVPFHPDGWQRRVLDDLDAQKSVFVVAPTSAGKTFISFYAMEKILRGNDDSVLVYVAPTKALVNQIAAEIQARFKKSYKHAGRSVWAIHTRDYRINNPLGCQILVTVPHILQIMLLAPSNAKAWSPRVKYIILDEIHSIGQAEDGVVWEQLLLLAPCPIIALSATVGNPDDFNSWLTATQESSGFEMSMITHQHRYSDLRKFVFTPPKRFAFRGLAERPSFATLGLDGLQGLAYIHPVASLINKSRGIPDDLSLEARDCLSLFQSMSRHQTKEFPIDPALSPLHKGSSRIIRKADIIEWEASLKKLLKVWMVNDQSPFDKVLEDLSRSMEVTSTIDKQASKGAVSDEVHDDMVAINPEDLYATTLPLLCKLHERDALPAIFFNYDRHRCEGICKAVIQQLMETETHWKESSPAWKAKLTGFEKWKAEQAKTAGKRQAKKLPAKKGKGDDDDNPSSKMDKIQDAASDEANPYANFDPDAPVDGFHFAARHKAEASELNMYYGQMKWRGLPSWLTDGLQRGIGVHHAGMNRKYRQVVEMLFRKGYLRVVIATGTLALGINMPCATVVFSGDSIFLTALNYRQAAGRAGRRGFDLLGNVVFQNISHGKICRLLSSRLPDLNGHFPITTTLVLRLFSLLHNSDDSQYAVKAINSLLSQPRLYLDGPAFKDQVLHHLRFSIEYLRRQDLLSSQGAPINFAGMTSHLYFTENSSFALNALIKGEYFHELCSEINTKESHVLRTLMVVMAHLFGRRPCREADEEYIENIVKRSPSIVFLPPLPLKAAQILRAHNQDTLQVFTTYVRTFVDQHVKEDDRKLPLTGMNAGGADDNSAFPGSLPPTKVRSAFVALSGHGDEFESISDLCRTTRSGVFLEETVIPHLDVYPDESKTPLNAYLYDFFMHGDQDALEKANGVKKSDSWFLLNDFSLVLATICASLANFLKLPESDLNLQDLIGEGDENNNLEDDKFGGDSTTDTESTTTSIATAETGRSSVTTASSTSAKTKAKKKVAESWDDSDAEEVDESEETNGTLGDDPSKEELEKGFLNVYRAMTKLRSEFDTKFRKIFA